MYNIAINRNMKSGFFIIIDGPSGSGKDTIIRQVLKDLKKLGVKATAIEETKEKKYDREKILTAKLRGNKEVAKTIINERKKLYSSKVIPYLSTNKLVIANRGESTTLGYQTIENEISMDEVWNMHRKQKIPLPNLVIIINCSVEEALRRESLKKPSSEEEDERFMSGKFTKNDRELINENYKKVKSFLEKKGVSVIYLDTTNITILQTSQKIVNSIKNSVQL